MEKLSEYERVVARLREHIASGARVAGVLGDAWSKLEPLLVQRGRSGGLITAGKLARDIGANAETVRKAVQRLNRPKALTARSRPEESPSEKLLNAEGVLLLSRRNVKEGGDLVGEPVRGMYVVRIDGKQFIVAPQRGKLRVVGRVKLSHEVRFTD